MMEDSGQPHAVLRAAVPRPVRTAVVVNPVKVADLDEHKRLICEGLAIAGWPEPLWLQTTPEDPGLGQARAAVRAGAEVVFVSGGDGTVRAAITGLAGTGVAMAVLPSGTGNLLAANLGLEGHVAAAVQVVLDGGRRLIDVGEVDETGDCFAVMAGMGFDAQMLAGTSERAKKRIGWFAYLFGAARHLRDRPMRVRIRLDGNRVLDRRARTVLIGNVGRLQGGVRLLADAEPDDGQFNVAVVTARSLGQWVVLGLGVLYRWRRVPRMELYTASEVEIRSNRAQPRQLDGDLIAPAEVLRVRLRPKALVLCVPRPERARDLAEGADRVKEKA
ncbi:diacylglycerol kinase family enzyme [Catenuloplanes niger]|uniref:Diacylglycerol kinase family enzyme n=2 Tax=Micromonosporaceae TaxID=28056 RepID=A0AAE3ZSQ2_9ACTN|nr:diacylglycerol kinase family enzyme [Catenuloplanes niger]